MPDQKPLHEGVPLEHAWVQGRRIYVRTPKESQLNHELIALGAKWDWNERARWVGTGKRDQVLPLVLADEERARARQQAAAELLAAGRWVQLPRDVEGVVTAMHSRAAKLGAVWDGPGFRYALPSDDHRAKLQEQLDAWLTERQAAKERTAAEEAAEYARQAEEERLAAVEAARKFRERIVAGSRRTLTGETTTVYTISTRYMNRATAEGMAWKLGTVRKLRDGRRGLVVGRDVWFTNEHDATDLDWHSDAPDEARWNFRYVLELVEPTEAEQRADAAAHAVRADAAALHALFRSRWRGHAVERFTVVAAADRVGTIRAGAGTPGVPSEMDEGTVILTVDGRVLWQHPGHYDTWTATEEITTDPDRVAQVRALLDAGPRTREHHDQLTYTYTVTTTATDQAPLHPLGSTG